MLVAMSLTPYATAALRCHMWQISRNVAATPRGGCASSAPTGWSSTGGVAGVVGVVALVLAVVGVDRLPGCRSSR